MKHLFIHHLNPPAQFPHSAIPRLSLGHRLNPRLPWQPQNIHPFHTPFRNPLRPQTPGINRKIKTSMLLQPISIPAQRRVQSHQVRIRCHLNRSTHMEQPITSALLAGNLSPTLIYSSKFLSLYVLSKHQLVCLANTGNNMIDPSNANSPIATIIQGGSPLEKIFPATRHPVIITPFQSLRIYTYVLTMAAPTRRKGSLERTTSFDMSATYTRYKFYRPYTSLIYPPDTLLPPRRL
jgi:hypothetical protein